MTSLREYADPDKRDRVIRGATGIDFSQYEYEGIGFDYPRFMTQESLDWTDVHRIQAEGKVGHTPLFELHTLTRMVRSISPAGYGARIFLKDEAANASGSFKARRASLAVAVAKERGYSGVIAATSGNYGAAVAAQAAMAGLKCIIVQEAYDSRGVGQPEILEKARACEALGAEVVQLTVGPELFLVFLSLLDETGYFSASLYAPYAVQGVETLGQEIAAQVLDRSGRHPDAVVVSHAGGGNVTGTARGLHAAGSDATRVIAASVNLRGLHMASDSDFNRKSFTTSHTGFGVPFLTNPDRVDLPRNAARSMRYIDEYVTVEQGEVMYATELLALSEGIERGPAGNTALAAAIALARTMPSDQTIVVQETEYTGAGKMHTAQLAFAESMGIEVSVGDPRDGVPGRSIMMPESPELIAPQAIDLRRTAQRVIEKHASEGTLSHTDITYLADETKTSTAFVEETVAATGKETT